MKVTKVKNHMESVPYGNDQRRHMSVSEVKSADSLLTREGNAEDQRLPIVGTGKLK